MSIIRRKGVAIVETKKGILVVAGRSKKFMLPGGGAERGESRQKAAIRELYEETNLKTKSSKYLFSYVGSRWHTHRGRSIRNHAKVFLIHAYRTPKPKNEIKHIAFWKPDSTIHITSGARRAITAFLSKCK
jgi:8-oxo-dGTP diphosphatase